MRNILFFSLITLVCTLGCGEGGYTVGGKVTYPDGTAVPTGQVTFSSGSFTGGGSIIGDGTYSTTVRIPAGTYKVSVTAFGEPPAAAGGRDSDEIPSGVSLVAQKYTNPETSELVCEVNGPTTFDITVTAP